MKKALLATLLIVPFALTSCGTGPQDKLLSIFTDLSCIDQFSANGKENSTKEGFDMKAFSAERSEMNKTLNAKMKGSFEKESDMKAAYIAISDKAAFKKQVASEAAKKCQAKPELVEEMFVEIDADTNK